VDPKLFLSDLDPDPWIRNLELQSGSGSRRPIYYGSGSRSYLCIFVVIDKNRLSNW